MVGLNETHTKSANQDREARCRDLERGIKKFVSADSARELSRQIQKTTLIKSDTLEFIGRLGTWIEFEILLGKTEIKVYFIDVKIEYDYCQPLKDYRDIDWTTVNMFLKSKGYKTNIEELSVPNPSLSPIPIDCKIFTVSWE